MGLGELAAEIGRLPVSERAALAKWLVQSLDELPEAEVEALRVAEAERRLDELAQGAAEPIPAEEALRDTRTGQGFTFPNPLLVRPDCAARFPSHSA